MSAFFSKPEQPPLINGATVIRLERQLDEQQKTVSPLRDDVNVLKLEHVGIQRDLNVIASNAKADVNGIAENLRALSTRFDESRKPNIPAIIGIFGLLPAFVAGMFYIFNGNVSSALVPIEIRTTNYQQNQLLHDREMVALQNTQTTMHQELSLLQQHIAANTVMVDRHEVDIRGLMTAEAAAGQFDTASLADRNQLNSRIKQAEDRLSIGMSERLASSAKMAAALTEIETQFKDIMRLIVLLWEKTYGARFPSDLNRETMVR